MRVCVNTLSVYEVGCLWRMTSQLSQLQLFQNNDIEVSDLAEVERPFISRLRTLVFTANRTGCD